MKSNDFVLNYILLTFQSKKIFKNFHILLKLDYGFIFKPHQFYKYYKYYTAF